MDMAPYYMLVGKPVAHATGQAVRSFVASLAAAILVLAWVAAASARAQTRVVTFDRDIAPLVFDRCAACHHPGGVAPFSLLEYESARQHASQIREVTRDRLMPPWRADSEYGPFIGQHPLTDREIDLIERWVSTGAAEGDARDLPPAPALTEGWQLGTPDLVVSLPQPYMLLRVDRVRFVRGVEFLPGNARVVHHANIRIDRTPASRRLDEQDPALGYEGLIAHSATYPDGHFLGWTPGQVAPLLPKGLAWRLEPQTDLVVEIHMQPSGKPEVVDPSIGFYFGSDPPGRPPAMLRLGRQSIDIPAGEKNYSIFDSFVLPVDVDVQAVQPHAHYRAHEVTGTATLPDGTTKTLIHLNDWDFRWQHVYRYETPVPLPKGTTLAMRYTYDNSADNPRNPTQPPQRVFWGQRSKDEMGDLWIQVLTKSDRDLDVLSAAFRPKMTAEDRVGYERAMQSDPTNAGLHDDAAMLDLDLGRISDAVAQFAASARLTPELPSAHFNLGTALSYAGRMDEAVAEFRRALEIRPDYPQAHNNLAGLLLLRGNISEALQHYHEAVRLDPAYAEAFGNMARAYAAAGQFDEAIKAAETAVRLAPPEPLASTLRSQLELYAQGRANP
jgi:Flp pilus assembly protein TadD/mono/diheme cytochrome c family protein